MARFTKVTFDGTDYKVPTLSLDQLERLTDLMASDEHKDAPQKKAFQMLTIITEDLEPKPEGKLRASTAEVQAALEAIIIDAGLRDANPPKAAAPAGAA